MPKTKKKTQSSEQKLHEARLKLAKAEYINKFLTTGSLLEAESQYRKTVGRLDAVIPTEVESEALNLKKQMLDVLDPLIRRVKREEYKEFELLHAQLRKSVLLPDIADAGIPDKIELSELKELSAEDLTYAINSFQKLQEMRRSILTT